MNDKQRARASAVKARIKEQGLTKRTPSLRLKCNVCDKVWPIHTQHPQMYTPSVQARWMCPLCKDSGKPLIEKEEPMAQSKEERNAKAREAYARRQGKASAPVVSKQKTSQSVAQTWIDVLASSVQGKFTDQQIATAMCAQTGRLGYVVTDVARHRSLYNNGQIKGQTAVPAKKLAKHG